MTPREAARLAALEKQVALLTRRLEALQLVVDFTASADGPGRHYERAVAEQAAARLWDRLRRSRIRPVPPIGGQQ